MQSEYARSSRSTWTDMRATTGMPALPMPLSSSLHASLSGCPCPLRTLEPDPDRVDFNVWKVREGEDVGIECMSDCLVPKTCLSAVRIRQIEECCSLGQPTIYHSWNEKVPWLHPTHSQTAVVVLLIGPVVALWAVFP